MTTRVLPTRTPEEAERAVDQAVELLREGAAVALPTETVYGLAADALNVDAVLKIFEAKERPRFDPLIVHFPDVSWLEELTTLPACDQQLVEALAQSFWPGPLTMVLARRPVVPDIVAAGLPTVAVRMSGHLIFQRISRKFGRPLAAPSANRFGRISPTIAVHVLSELEGRIPLIVDGGATTHGLESTIVAVRGGHMEVLRPGPITTEQLAPFGKIQIAPAPEQPEAPGQLRSHYAPRTPLLLAEELASFTPPIAQRTGALAFGNSPGPSFAECRILSQSGDMREAAANLFRHLRELDQANLDLIVAEKLPETGLGAAIMDRLRRASTRD